MSLLQPQWVIPWGVGRSKAFRKQVSQREGGNGFTPILQVGDMSFCRPFGLQIQAKISTVPLTKCDGQVSSSDAPGFGALADDAAGTGQACDLRGKGLVRRSDHLPLPRRRLCQRESAGPLPLPGTCICRASSPSTAGTRTFSANRSSGPDRLDYSKDPRVDQYIHALPAAANNLPAGNGPGARCRARRRGNNQATVHSGDGPACRPRQRSRGDFPQARGHAAPDDVYGAGRRRLELCD